ncbi:MAG: hypothetical protein ACOX35_04380 [Bacillota bacterium]|jgi:hypothetical protein|nr:hypothetical protein [Candidatus Fermentithermobacillaceae bacterium]
MKIFGVDVNPYELFLILILLLAATGAFDAHAARAGKKDSSQKRESPVRFLKAPRRRAAGKTWGSDRQDKQS